MGPTAAIFDARPLLPSMSAGTQTDADTGGPSNPSPSNILEAIKACKDTLTIKMDYLATDISLIRHGLDTFRTRMSEAEDGISHLEDSTRTDSRELHALQLQVKALQYRAIDT